LLTPLSGKPLGFATRNETSADRFSGHFDPHPSLSGFMQKAAAQEVQPVSTDPSVSVLTDRAKDVGIVGRAPMGM
jgi:hypothetical protein